MGFGEQLKQARKEKKMSQQALADLLGVNRIAISNYENDKNTPTLSNLKKIISVLDLDSNYFDDEKRFTSVRIIPITGTASCGGSEMDYLQDTDRTCYYNGDFFTESLYCVIANGDSMAPEIEDGDEVVCDPDVTPQSGDIVHYTINSESAIKVFVEDKEANLLQLVPYNATDDFKTRTIRLDDDEAYDLKLSKVVAVNKLKFNNRASRLRLIGRL